MNQQDWRNLKEAEQAFSTQTDGKLAMSCAPAWAD